ncbi:hypothetical protein C8Q79DRAFT_196253 [Trametes meyenii]|nr:hypothetical protein C8Q79DRAFT_196253 [Trametes meyenii]
MQDFRASVNLDTFRYIMRFMSRSDLLQMAYASRFIREEVSKELLLRPVHVRHAEALHSFCQFLLYIDHPKLASVRSLTFERINCLLTPEEKDLLFWAISHCTNLKELSLKWCDVVIKDDPRFMKAVSSLKTLTHFVVGCYVEAPAVHGLIFQAVIHMESPLRQLNIPLNLDAEAWPDPLADLFSAHSRLEELALSLPYFSNPRRQSLQSLRKLHLAVHQQLPSHRDLYEAFPNLRELRLECYFLLSNSLAEHDEERTAAVHSIGRASTWRSLDAVQAPLPVTLALGIICPVRSLDIGYYDRSLHGEIVKLVDRLRPRKIIICAYWARRWNSFVVEPSLLLYKSSATSGVRYLVAKMSFSVDMPPSTLDIAYFQPLLSPSRTEFFQLALAEVFHSEDIDDIAYPSPRVPLHPKLEDIVRLFDVEVIARELAESCAALQTITIAVALRGRYFWSVERTDSRLVLKRLELSHGRELERRETLRCLED